MDLVAAARELGLPLLAVCRGLQVLNVAFGGTLRQHLDTTVAHQDETHTVDVIPGSCLHAITGREMLTVSSYHHQGIDRLGAGLTPTALSPDGVVEALETGEILAVQWHPEDLAARSGTDAALFTDLVERAAKTEGH